MDGLALFTFQVKAGVSCKKNAYSPVVACWDHHWARLGLAAVAAAIIVALLLDRAREKE